MKLTNKQLEDKVRILSKELAEEKAKAGKERIAFQSEKMSLEFKVDALKAELQPMIDSRKKTDDVLVLMHEHQMNVIQAFIGDNSEEAKLALKGWVTGKTSFESLLKRNL